MKINKFYIILILYFFFNTVGLPIGLLYTSLLTPFFFIWLRKKKKYPIQQFVLYSCPYVVIHLFLGLDLLSFIKSYTLLFTAYIFTYSFYFYLKEKRDIGVFFKKLLILNFIACLIAVIVYFTPYREWLWTIRHLTLTIKDFPRMELLSYEPSYYATLFVPIFLYYAFKLLIKKHETEKVIGYLIMICFPLVLSFSMGVIASLSITLLACLIVFGKHFFRKKVMFNSIVSISILTSCSIIILLVFYPENPLMGRINDVLDGQDLSAKGRTTDAFLMSTLVAKTKSLFFGVGIGQIKIMGEDVVRNYYKYNVVDIPIIRIPSSIGETIGTFGYVGLAIRLVIEFYLFFKTKVIDNYYRTAIFIYIFIYQFTGSFLTNIAEYVLWVIAFTPSFYQFNVRQKIAPNN